YRRQLSRTARSPRVWHCSFSFDSPTRHRFARTPRYRSLYWHSPLQRGAAVNEPVRLDKWLWAARFYKTRSLCRQAIEQGRVKASGQRVKPSRLVKLGDSYDITQGHDLRTVLVTGLAEKRGNAQAAALLYEETAASIVAREAAAERRRLAYHSVSAPPTKPTKKQRRDIEKFRRQHLHSPFSDDN